MKNFKRLRGWGLSQEGHGSWLLGSRKFIRKLLALWTERQKWGGDSEESPGPSTRDRQRGGVSEERSENPWGRNGSFSNIFWIWGRFCRSLQADSDSQMGGRVMCGAGCGTKARFSVHSLLRWQILAPGNQYPKDSQTGSQYRAYMGARGQHLWNKESSFNYLSLGSSWIVPFHSYREQYRKTLPDIVCWLPYMPIYLCYTQRNTHARNEKWEWKKKPPFVLNPSSCSDMNTFEWAYLYWNNLCELECRWGACNSFWNKMGMYFVSVLWVVALLWGQALSLSGLNLSEWSKLAVNTSLWTTVVVPLLSTGLLKFHFLQAARGKACKLRVSFCLFFFSSKPCQGWGWSPDDDVKNFRGHFFFLF